MFDLNQSINDWQNSLKTEGAADPQDLNELESHLREEIENLIKIGLSEEESFLIASRRLGDTKSLGEEYTKVNLAAAWQFRVLWMAAGILIMNFLFLISYTVQGIGVILLHSNEISTSVLFGIAIASKLIAIGLTVFILIKILRPHKTAKSDMTGKSSSRAIPLISATLFILLSAGSRIVIMLFNTMPPIFLGFKKASIIVYGDTLFNFFGSIILNGFLAGLVIYLYSKRSRTCELPE